MKHQISLKPMNLLMNRLCFTIRGENLRCRLHHFRGMSSSVTLAFNRIANKDVEHNRSPLLIFHGLFGSKNNWNNLGKQLAARTKRVVYTFDLRNHGDSPHSSDTDLVAMSNDIGHFVQSNDLEKVCILGHSLGGRVASQFAFKMPTKVDKLILADITPLERLPSVDFINDSLFYDAKQAVQNLPPQIELSKARVLVGQELMKRMKNKFIVDFFLMSLYKDQTKSIKWKFNLDALNNLVSNRLINKIDVKQPFTGPVLIVYGQNSNYVQLNDFDEIRKIMPSVEFVEISDAGHYLHVEKPNEFMEPIVRFLK